jgi:hypothetical protein
MSTNKIDLFNKPTAEWTTDDLKNAVDIYKILIDMADKVSQRRQNANNFYLSVNTAITGASAYLASSTNNNASVLLISIVGFFVCLLWKRNIDSYKDLNNGKFAVITELEKALPIAPFRAEWDVLERGENKKQYRPFHTVEVFVPIIFAGLYFVQCVRSISWASLVTLVFHR